MLQIDHVQVLTCTIDALENQLNSYVSCISKFQYLPNLAKDPMHNKNIN